MSNLPLRKAPAGDATRSGPIRLSGLTTALTTSGRSSLRDLLARAELAGLSGGAHSAACFFEWRHLLTVSARSSTGSSRCALGVRNPDILNFGMTSTTIQVRGRGTLTLPASLREKYRLGEGDPLTVVDLDGAVLLSPRVLVVPRLAAEMERLRRAHKLSLKDLGGPVRED